METESPEKTVAFQIAEKDDVWYYKLRYNNKHIYDITFEDIKNLYFGYDAMVEAAIRHREKDERPRSEESLG